MLSSHAGLRRSLVVTWLATAAISVWEWHGMSTDLLREAGMDGGPWRTAVLGAGVAVDAVVGVLLWRWPGRWVYRMAALQVLVMTGIATWLLPSLWLHPLGPLLKNLPILALLRHLETEEGVGS